MNTTGKIFYLSLYAFYFLLWIFFFPVILFYTLCRPQDRKAFFQRLTAGQKKLVAAPGTILIHACSVGEVNSISPLICAFQSEYIPAVISTVTLTGLARAEKLWPELKCFLMPFDFLFFFRFANPQNIRAIYICETEIWPGMLLFAAYHGIKVKIINARISDTSFPRYRKMPFLSFFLNIPEEIIAQSLNDEKRFISLGRKRQISVMPNLKYWSVPLPLIPDCRLFPGNFSYFTAGSTHEGEEEIIFSVFLNLKKKHPELRLIIAPRHPSRAVKVQQTASSSGITAVLRSSMTAPSEAVLIDSIGELSGLYTLPGVCFIGGSLVKAGGHNPLEAVFAGKIPVCGIHTFNFRDIVSDLKTRGLYLEASDENQLTDFLLHQLSSENGLERFQTFFIELEQGKSQVLSRLISTDQ